jgi:phosphatidylserine/phosphatidylglycerophosphate/cardiolipin synthase-like enzyme
MSNSMFKFLTLLALLGLQACATAPPQAPACESGMAMSAHGCAPSGAVEDGFVNEIYERRTWKSYEELEGDPVQMGANAEIPVQSAYGKILGPTHEDARNSLVSKLYLIDNAQHTVDFVYYIFANDLVGYSMIGALCNAVQRGVDVRVMVDAAGSMSADKTSLRALSRCGDRAGFIRNANGDITTRRARMQLMTFNALTNFKGSPNRRSHDKLLVIDGSFKDRAYVMTGGRNISLAYYGISPEGEVDDHAYRDAEILLRADPESGEVSVGDVSEIYYSLLFLYRGNRSMLGTDTDQAQDIYRRELAKAYEALRQTRDMPLLQPHWQAMPDYLTQNFRQTQALLVHELTNLDNKRVVKNAIANFEQNPNSVLFVIDQIQKHTGPTELTRIVSPYLFLAQYKDENGEISVDGAAEMLRYLDENPDAEIEIITNSVLTSDNFSAQAIIDFDTGPRLLLDSGLSDSWLITASDQERTAALTNSVAWKEQISHPRLRVYETGGLDSDYFEGGDYTYGKLHAKFFHEGDIAYVGTSNFDYRSRLYNNEMGFIIQSQELVDDLNKAFDYLLAKSYRWGSPEWLELREKTMGISGMKGWSTRNQRAVFKTLKGTGLHWLF